MGRMLGAPALPGLRRVLLAVSTATACEHGEPRSSWAPERLRWNRSRSCVRVSPAGEFTSAVWICSARGSPACVSECPCGAGGGVVPERER